MLRVEKTETSRNDSNNQWLTKSHSRDREDVESLLGKIGQSIGHPTGPCPAELHLLQAWYDISSEKQFADLVPMLKAHLDFIEAKNANKARGYSHPSFCDILGDKARLCIRQHEMNRCEMVRHNDGKPEPGEWFFDQEWSFKHDSEPTYGFSFKTLNHGAYGREPIVYRHAEFWMHQENSLPETLTAAIHGRKFGEIVDTTGRQSQFLGRHLDEWNIADVSNDTSIDMITIKLSQPECPKD